MEKAVRAQLEQATDEELFNHEVTAWTVGDLRKAMEGVPDGLPLRVFIPVDPGADPTLEQVVHDAAPWDEVNGGAENPDLLDHRV